MRRRRGGIVPEQWGYEAGQSGVGDIFAWYVENGVPPAYHEQARALGIGVHEHLTALGAAQNVGEHGLVALDWWSGNRSVLVDHELSGVLVGMTLATRAHEIYRALVEATAFGTRKIIDTFNDAGVGVREFVAAGGLLRNEPLMQCYADVIGLPISVIGSDQGPALGSAMHAAVAAGVHPDIYAAARAMGRCRRDVYRPDAERAAAYDELYALYGRLHDHFGRGRARADALAVRRSARARRRRPSDERRGRGSAPHRRGAARRADAQRPGRLDDGQHLGARAGSGADRDQAERRRLRRADRRVDGRRRPARHRRRGRALAVQRHRDPRLRLPRDGRGSAASPTPTARTRRRGRRTAWRSPAC